MWWNLDRMQALYQTDRVAKALLDVMGGSNQAVYDAVFSKKPGFILHQITVDQVIKATRCRRAAAVGVLKAFAGCGCGVFRAGRRGRLSRLDSNRPLRKIAEEVVGKVSGATSAATAAATAPGTQFVEQHILLRPGGVQFTVRFPEDMTKEEAEKAAGVVRNLWLAPGAKGE
jgi:hypothetical protein